MGEVAGWSVHYHPLGNGLPYFYGALPQRLVTTCRCFKTLPSNMMQKSSGSGRHPATVGKATHPGLAFIQREYRRVLDYNSFTKNRLFLYISG
jgi:hypothetical protein